MDTGKGSHFAAEFGAEAPRRRRSDRAASTIEARIGGAYCRVLDVSVHGARLQSYSELERGTAIWLALPGIGRCAAIVVWARGFEAGVEFKNPLSAKAFETLAAL